MFSKSDFKSYLYATTTLVRISDRIDNIADLHYNNSRTSSKQCYLFTLLLIISFVNAAPQSCILCDKEDIDSKDPTNNYEEYFFEHQVTRQDAVNALKQMNESSYGSPSLESSCKSITCSKIVMRYCIGPQFINDHCLCESGHNNEGLPFIPHICYVGEKLHTAFVGSCFFYEEVKDCCCVGALAKQWRHISGSRSIHNLSGFLVATAACMLASHLFRTYLSL